MNAVQEVSDERRDQIIEDSIRRQAHTLLTHQDSQGWRTFKSKFVSGSKPTDLLRVQASIPGEGPAAVFPEPGETLGITFRLSHKKCMFSSVVRSTEQTSDGTIVTLRWPEHLQQLQRRAYERAEPPAGLIIAVRFWSSHPTDIGDSGSRNVRHGELIDLSAGGMRINVRDQIDIELGHAYQCVFSPQPGVPSLMLEAMLRHRETAAQGRALLGFQFVGLEATPDGRNLLDRLARSVRQFKIAGARVPS